MKSVRTTFCTGFFTLVCTPRHPYVAWNDIFGRNPRQETRRGKITKSGGSVPGFPALRRPKPVRGRSRPSALHKQFEISDERTDTMPLIKKAPAIISLEIKIEEPVKQLLEDYARFIDSTPDHVVNAVIKKNLWRDQDYRKWREQQRADALHSSSPQKG